MWLSKLPLSTTPVCETATFHHGRFRAGVFGYDISTERIPNSDRVRVTIAPLSLSVDQLEAGSGAKKLSAFRFLVLPRYPSLVVANGDTITLDLLVSVDGKQKIVDYIQISYKSVERRQP